MVELIVLNLVNTFYLLKNVSFKQSPKELNPFKHKIHFTVNTENSIKTVLI